MSKQRKSMCVRVHACMLLLRAWQNFPKNREEIYTQTPLGLAFTDRVNVLSVSRHKRQVTNWESIYAPFLKTERVSAKLMY